MSYYSDASSVAGSANFGMQLTASAAADTGVRQIRRP
jgi:hypothetical protein